MTRNDNANSHSPSTTISSDTSVPARASCLSPPEECRRHLVHEPVAGHPVRQPALPPAGPFGGSDMHRIEAICPEFK